MKQHMASPISGLVFVLVFITSFSVRGQAVRVAIAANTEFVMQAMKRAYEEKGQSKIDLIISSSGKLTAQITHGAPYDIFLSADMKYPEHLYKAGYALHRPDVYAYGRLVLWTLKNIDIDAGFEILKSPEIRTIAVANPATAPYGVAAIQALKEAGVYRAVRDKIVFGESISQVNQYLLSGVADVAFTAKSVVNAPGLTDKGKWTEPADSLYSPIMQGAVILKHASQTNLTAAQAFYRFLSSSEGKAIFQAYGYRTR
jgi:molybdate transport system substrate-binding protein